MAGYIWAILVPPIVMFKQGRVGMTIITLFLMVFVVTWPLASLLAVLATRAQHIHEAEARSV